jgi:hypothetical protein
MEIALAIILGLLFACALAGIVAMTALGPGGETTLRVPHPLSQRKPVPPHGRARSAEPRPRDRAA